MSKSSSALPQRLLPEARSPVRRITRRGSREQFRFSIAQYYVNDDCTPRTTKRSRFWILEQRSDSGGFSAYKTSHNDKVTLKTDMLLSVKQDPSRPKFQPPEILTNYLTEFLTNYPTESLTDLSQISRSVLYAWS